LKEGLKGTGGEGGDKSGGREGEELVSAIFQDVVAPLSSVSWIKQHFVKHNM